MPEKIGSIAVEFYFHSYLKGMVVFLSKSIKTAYIGKCGKVRKSAERRANDASIGIQRLNIP